MKQEIYFDNAATTSIHPEVKEVMLPYMSSHFGNPSSTHRFGRVTKNIIEKARKSIAERLGAAPAEIFFTSGGTESDNSILIGHVFGYAKKNNVAFSDLHIISSPLEHHAVGHTLEYLYEQWGVNIHYVDCNDKGDIDLNHLEQLLKQYPCTLVSLMHANNEIGNIYDVQKIGDLVKEHDAFFHSDTVQTVGHLPINFEASPIDYGTSAAHKIHGPKGIGLLYAKKGHPSLPFIHGGGQERNFRGGTENFLGIVGIEKAIALAYDNLDERKNYILNLKKHMISEMKKHIPNIMFNGRSDELDQSLFTVLNVNVPYQGDPEMLLFKLDIEGVACSGGSACSSGSEQGSHVIRAIHGKNEGYVPIRFSFSHNNTIQEIEKTMEILKRIGNFDV